MDSRNLVVHGLADCKGENYRCDGIYMICAKYSII